MSFVTDHPINGRWPAENPDVLQLYAFPTPNGVKVDLQGRFLTATMATIDADGKLRVQPGTPPEGVQRGDR